MYNNLGTQGIPDVIPIETGEIDSMLELIDKLINSPLGNLFDLDHLMFIERTQQVILNEIPSSVQETTLREQMIGEARQANNCRQWFSQAKQSLLNYKQQLEEEYERRN